MVLPMKTGWVGRGGVRLHYREWGPPAPSGNPILLLHGLSSNSMIWARVAAHLEGRRVVAPDQRSHGLSDSPQEGNTAAEMVEDMAALIHELGLERCLVVGHSWGAAVALELAATHAELAAGLVCVDGAVNGFSKMMSWEEMALRMQPPLPHWADLEAAYAAQRRYTPEAWAADLEEFVRAGLVQGAAGFTYPLTAEVRLQILRAMFELDGASLWTKVEGPVVLALAARTFAGAPAEWLQRRREAVAEIQELRPDSHAVWFDSPHDIPLYRPLELAQTLERALLAAAWWDVERSVRLLEGDWSRPAQVEEGFWSGRELLAHVASSASVLARLIGAAGPAGAAPDEPFDVDRWNASQQRRRQESPVSDLKREVRTAVAALSVLLQSAPLDALVGGGRFGGQTVLQANAEMLQHCRGHLEELSLTLA